MSELERPVGAAVIRALGAIAELQWGLLTTRQAADVGVSRLQLSRLAAAGALERVDQGVYRVAGAPQHEHQEILAAWLALTPHTESAGGQPAVVVAGITAARLHGIGNLWLRELEFITPTRRTTRRPGIHLTARALSPDEITTAAGVPTLTAARVIADQVIAHADLSLVAEQIRDADYAGILNRSRLAEHLDAVSAEIGAAFLAELFTIAGLSYRRGAG